MRISSSQISRCIVCCVANLQSRECQGKVQEEVSVEAMEAVMTRSRSELIQSIAAEAFVAPSRDRLSQAAYRFDTGTQRGAQSKARCLVNTLGVGTARKDSLGRLIRHGLTSARGRRIALI